MENDNFMKNKILCGVLRESITSQQERAPASWRQTTGRASSLDAGGAPLCAHTSLPGVLRESPCLRSGRGQGAGVECLGEGRAPAESSTVRATAGRGGNLVGGRASLGGGPVLRRLLPGWRRAPGRLGDGGGQAGVEKSGGWRALVGSWAHGGLGVENSPTPKRTEKRPKRRLKSPRHRSVSAV
jgi:hypothetical protein